MNYLLHRCHLYYLSKSLLLTADKKVAIMDITYFAITSNLQFIFSFVIVYVGLSNAVCKMCSLIRHIYFELIEQIDFRFLSLLSFVYSKFEMRSNTVCALHPHL